MVWKWELQMGNEVEVMQVQWYRRECKAVLVEVGLHYRDKSSSVQRVIQA